MVIIGIFKEAQDLVIIKHDDGEIEVRASFVDEGTEEDRALIKSTMLSTGFKPAYTDYQKSEQVNNG